MPKMSLLHTHATKRVAALIATLLLVTACQEPNSEPTAAQTEVAPVVPADPAIEPTPLDATAKSLALEPWEGCNLEAIVAGAGATPFTARAGATLVASGWFANAANSGRPENPMLRLVAADGATWQLPLVDVVARPDVAASRGAEGLVDSGFNQMFGLGDLPPGRYQLLLVDVSGSSGIACDNGRTLEVTP